MNKNRTKSIRQLEKNMCKKITAQNVRQHQINKNKNKRVRFSYKNMFKSKNKRKMTSHNILLKKAIVNRTKLRCSRQKIINHRNNIKNLKNIREKSITIYDIYRS